MMTRRIRKAGCLILALILLPAASLAGSIDDLIGLLTRPGSHAAEITLQAEAVRIPELSETRTEWLNRLLKHLTIRLRTDGEIQEESIEVDGRTALSCMNRNSADGSEYQFSFDAGKVYRLPEGNDLLSELSGITADPTRLDSYSETAVLMDGFYTFFSGLPAAFPEQSSVSKASVSFKPYGTAVKRWTLSFTDDILQSEQMAEYLAGEEMAAVREYLSHAVLSGRQRLTLLTDENDRLMKVNYTGKAGLSEEDLRNVNLDWRCPRGETDYKDTLRLTTPAVQGSRRDNLTVTQEMKVDPEGREEYTGLIETDRVENRVRTRIRLEFSLTAEEGVISGDLQEKTIVGNSAETTAVKAELERKAPDEYHGSLEITHNMDKIEKEHFRFLLTAGSCDALKWTAGQAVTMTEEGQAATAEKAARVFLKALKNVPEEDLQYFLADLPAGTWKQIIGNTEEPEETEQP